jgi:hypothetical protein
MSPAVGIQSQAVFQRNGGSSDVCNYHHPHPLLQFWQTNTPTASGGMLETHRFYTRALFASSRITEQLPKLLKLDRDDQIVVPVLQKIKN